MTLQTTLDQLEVGGWNLLAGAARGGVHTMPAGFAEAIDELDALAAQQPPAGARAARDAGSMDKLTAEMALGDWRAKRDRQADALLQQVGKTIAYQGGRLIEEHVAPALEARLAAFRADLDLIGPYATLISPNNALMLERDQKLREAWHRFSQMAEWYLPLRASWATLRRYDTQTADELGDAGILSEIANAPELIGERWRETRAWGANAPWVGPWEVNAPHVRMAWIVRHGGRVWFASARQQTEAHAPYAPKPRFAPGSDPRDTIYQLAGVRGQAA